MRLSSALPLVAVLFISLPTAQANSGLVLPDGEIGIYAGKVDFEGRATADALTAEFALGLLFLGFTAVDSPPGTGASYQALRLGFESGLPVTRRFAVFGRLAVQRARFDDGAGSAGQALAGGGGEWLVAPGWAVRFALYRHEFDGAPDLDATECLVGVRFAL